MIKFSSNSSVFVQIFFQYLAVSHDVPDYLLFLAHGSVEIIGATLQFLYLHFLLFYFLGLFVDVAQIYRHLLLHSLQLRIFTCGWTTRSWWSWIGNWGRCLGNLFLYLNFLAVNPDLFCCRLGCLYFQLCLQPLNFLTIFSLNPSLAIKQTLNRLTLLLPIMRPNLDLVLQHQFLLLQLIDINPHFVYILGYIFYLFLQFALLFCTLG